MPVTERVMRPDRGMTHADFRRIFPRLLGDAETVEGDLNCTVLWHDGRCLKVQVSDEKTRAIATLRMPYLDICFEFSGFDDSERDAFLARFERAFQKGGG